MDLKDRLVERPLYSDLLLRPLVLMHLDSDVSTIIHFRLL